MSLMHWAMPIGPPSVAMQATDTAEFLASMMDEQQSSEPWFGAIQSLWCWKHINENGKNRNKLKDY